MLKNVSYAYSDIFVLVDGNWGSWGPWGDCLPFDIQMLTKKLEISANIRVRPCAGVQARARICNNPPASNGGRPCPGSKYDYRACPLDCKGKINLVEN